MTATMSTIMSGLFQLGYVTNDFERGLDHLQRAFELPKWQIFRDVQLSDTKVKGRPGTWGAHVGLAMCGDLNIELIGPTSGEFDFYKTEWREDAFVCYQHHYGVHVGQDKAALDAAVRHAVEQGGVFEASGNFAGLGDFAYVDARASIGKHLELVALNQGGRDFFAELTKQYR